MKHREIETPETLEVHYQPIHVCVGTYSVYAVRDATSHKWEECFGCFGTRSSRVVSTPRVTTYKTETLGCMREVLGKPENGEVCVVSGDEPFQGSR